MERKEPTLWLRNRGKAGRWYVRDGKVLVSTGCAASDVAGARAALANYLALLTPKPTRGTPAGHVRLRDVFDHARSRGERDLDATTRYGRRGLTRQKSLLSTLKRHLGSLSIGDLGSSTFASYVVARTSPATDKSQQLAAAMKQLRIERASSAGSNGRSVTHASARTELEGLRTMVRGYAKEHGLTSLPKMPLPRPIPRARVEISRADVARLLWATRGRHWDAKAGGWKPSDSVTRSPRKSRSTAVARTILVAMYSASHCWCVVRARWQREDDATSFVDLDVDPPVLHRLGPDAASGKMAGVPVMLNRRILAHLRRWRDADRRKGLKAIVHFDGKPMSKPSHATFTKLLRAAGLSERITMDDLRLSAGAHLARRRDVTMRSAALLLGMNVRGYVVRYKHLTPEYNDRVMTAFATQPTSHRRDPSVEKHRRQPGKR